VSQEFHCAFVPSKPSHPASLHSHGFAPYARLQQTRAVIVTSLCLRAASHFSHPPSPLVGGLRPGGRGAQNRELSTVPISPVGRRKAPRAPPTVFKVEGWYFLLLTHIGDVFPSLLPRSSPVHHLYITHINFIGISSRTLLTAARIGRYILTVQEG